MFSTFDCKQQTAVFLKQQLKCTRHPIVSFLLMFQSGILLPFTIGVSKVSCLCMLLKARYSIACEISSLIYSMSGTSMSAAVHQGALKISLQLSLSAK